MPVLQFVLALLVVILGRFESASTQECAISKTWNREIPARIIPTASDDKFTLTWQDRAHIYLQRYAADCTSIGSSVAVNMSLDFLSSPTESGLSDAAALEGSDATTAVVWVLYGDVFVSVVRDGRPGPAVRANHQMSGHRADARVTSNPSGPGFVVSWSSWRQEDHTWGVFARRFDAYGQSTGTELLLNQDGRSLNKDPQLAWCSTSIWASWKRDCIDGACKEGYVVRYLGDSYSWKPHPEVVYPSSGISSALACKGQDALLVWLAYDGGRMFVHWDVNEGNASSFPHRAEIQQSVRGTVAARTSAKPFLSILGTYLPLSFLFRFSSNNLSKFQTKEELLLEGSPRDGSGSRIYVQQPGPELEFGQISMIAQGEFVMMLGSSSLGRLETRLLDFSTGGHLQMTAAHAVASGTQHARASLDSAASGGLHGVTICWGYTDDNDQDGGYQCLKRGAWWLVDNDVFGLGGLTIPGLFVLLFCVFWIFRRCHFDRVGGFNGGNASGPRQSADVRRRRDRARTNELRQQLTQIPLQPVVSQSPPASEGSTDQSAQEGGSTVPPASSRTTASTECAICQQDVNMRVALRPCGHTACRECTENLIRLVQPCHICRGTIEGLLPVYI